MKSSIFMETTEVSAQKSIADISALLVAHGAVAFTQEMQDGRVTGLSFVLPVNGGRLPFKLPVRTDRVFQKIQKNRVYSKSNAEAKDRDQAERIAWRQLFWWLKAQFSLIELGMVESAEVLTPYMLGADGRTFFETYRGKLLEGKV